MANTGKCWKTEKGELFFDFTSKNWYFISGSRKIYITSWRVTKKGPIKGPVTEIVLEDEEKQVIIEILEKKFNKELYLPEQADKTMKKVEELCKIILSIETDIDNYWRRSSLILCVLELMRWNSKEIKAIHTYYGNGLFFGMRKNIFGKTKILNSIPSRCMEFPGTRLDNIAD